MRKELRLSVSGRQLMSNQFRVFSTPLESLSVYKILQTEGPMDLEVLKSILVGTPAENRTWTPTLVENIVAQLIHIGTVETLE